MRLLLLSAFVFAASAAQAQAAYSPPRAADGSPDFGGVWFTRFVTQAERPPGMPGPIVPHADGRSLADQLLAGAPEVIDPDFAFVNVRELAEVQGALRTSLLVDPPDGALPFTRAGEQMAAEYDRRFMKAFDNPEERDNFERCLSGVVQAPIRPYPAPIHFQFVQTPDQLVIWAEDVQSLRIVHLKAEPPPQAVRSRDGWSAGRWEGDTLVVTTTHLRGDDPFRATMARSLIVTESSRVVERFTRISETELHYAFTIQDPAIYARPWRAEFSFRLGEAGATVLEYACHEANYSLVHILNGGRQDDRPRLDPGG